MRFASLGSGSRGNATLVESDSACVLIDCGFSVRETERRLARLGRSAADLSAVLVTHEHSDHCKGVAALARKYQLPVYATKGTALAAGLQDSRWQRLQGQQSFTVADLMIEPVTVPHDAAEPCQFVLRNSGFSLGVLTDLGSITALVIERYAACDALMLECNHDTRMLATGPYPPSLKRRVGGAWGHLNNMQAASLLAQVDQQRLQHVVMSHLSAQNNTEMLARDALAETLSSGAALVTADQDEGLDWLQIV